MLYQVNMPKSFWAKVIITAAYILNRLLSNSVEGISHELWHGIPLTSEDLQSIKFSDVSYMQMSLQSKERSLARWILMLQEAVSLDIPVLT